MPDVRMANRLFLFSKHELLAVIEVHGAHGEEICNARTRTLPRKCPGVYVRNFDLDFLRDLVNDPWADAPWADHHKERGVFLTEWQSGLKRHLHLAGGVVRTPGGPFGFGGLA